MSFFKDLNIRATFVVLCVAILAGMGCKKPWITSEKFQSSNLNVICTWDANDVPVAFSLDTTVRLYGGDLSFGDQTAYQVLFSGSRTAKFKNEDVTPPLVYLTTIDMQPGKAYSLFFTGIESNPESIFVEDDVSSPGNNKTRFRVANMNPDPASKYDIYFQVAGGSMQKVFSAVGSKTVSESLGRDSTTALHIITAINPGVDTIALGNNSTRFLPEKAYTIVIAGKKGGVNNQQILVNENFYRY